MKNKKSKNNRIYINSLLDKLGLKDLIIDNPEDLEKFKSELEQATKKENEL